MIKAYHSNWSNILHLNTDGTDLEDMFDIDSDNDGCYDVIVLWWFR